MKIIITESQYDRLFNDLPVSLKRRITQEDLEWLDQELIHHIVSNGPTNKFDDFSDYVIGDLLHGFLVNRKDEEIDTVEDPVYGLVYDDESLSKVGDLYWALKPFLEKKYEKRLYRAWEIKKSK